MTGDEARSAESVRRTLGAWLDGTNDPPTGLVDDGWRQARWDELCDAIGKDPQTWLDVSLTVIEETPWKDLGMIGVWPFRALLAVGGDSIEGQVLEIARVDPKVAGIYVMAMEDVIGDHGHVWSGLTAVVRRLGSDVAVAATARIAEAAQTSAEGRDFWDSPDEWAFGLGGRLAANDPELAWTFILGVIEAVPETVLGYVGASEVEDFCWEVAPAFIERIEAEAARSPRFRIALGSVWPGGETIPPDTYGRIRTAAQAP